MNNSEKYISKSAVYTKLVPADLIESPTDAVVIVDRESRVVYVNPRFETMFGHTYEEIVGGPHDLLVPKEVLETHRKETSVYFFSPLERPMGIGLELSARRKDDSVFPAEIGLNPMETEDGLVVVCVIRALTD